MITRAEHSSNCRALDVKVIDARDYNLGVELILGPFDCIRLATGTYLFLVLSTGITREVFLIKLGIFGGLSHTDRYRPVHGKREPKTYLGKRCKHLLVIFAFIKDEAELA